MNDSMASRVGRLISASINAMIDTAEGISPIIVMKEGIREVESILGEVKVALGKESVQKIHIERNIEVINNEYKKLSFQIGVVIENNRDDLAKVAIAKQMDLESQIVETKENLENAESNISKLEDYMDALKKKREELKKELESHIKINKEQKNSSNINLSIDRIDNLFDRVSNKAQSNLMKEDIQLSQLDNLTKESEISQRLANLKKNKS